MTIEHYRTRRRRLLEAIAWNRWAASKGYSPDARARCKAQQQELVLLRRARPAALVYRYPAAA